MITPEMEVTHDLLKSLKVVVSRLESLISGVNSAIETHDTEHLLSYLGCIGTDIDRAKQAIKAGVAITDPHAWRRCHIPGYEQRKNKYGHIETRPIARAETVPEIFDHETGRYQPAMVRTDDGWRRICPSCEPGTVGTHTEDCRALREF